MGTPIRTCFAVCFVMLTCCSPNAISQQEWKVFISEGKINSIAVNRDSVWVATESGILLYNRRTQTTKLYSSADGLAQNKAQRSITISRSGTVACAGNYDGLSILRPGNSRWSKYFVTEGSADYSQTEPLIGKMAFDSQDNLYVTDWATTGGQFNFPKAKKVLRTGCVAVDSSDNAWFGGSDANIKKYDRLGNVTVYDSIDNGGGFYATNDIIVDPLNRVWAASGLQGIAVFDGTSWKVYDASNSGLPDNDVDKIGVDKYGNIIVEVDLQSLWKFDGSGWSRMINLPFSFWNGEITAMGRGEDGHLFVGYKPFGQSQPTFLYAAAELYEFDGDSWSKISLKTGNFGYGDARTIAADQDGQIWTGVLGAGLLSYDGNGWQTHYAGNINAITSTYISAITFDKLNSLWTVTGDYTEYSEGIGGSYFGGVSSFDGSQWTTWTTNMNLKGGQPTFRDCEMFIDSKDNKWIDGQVEGLYKFDGSQWTSYPLVGYVPFTVDSNAVLWYVHGDTLIAFDGKTSSYYPTGTGMGISCDKLAVAKDGSFWAVLGNFGVDSYLTNNPTWKLARFKDGAWTTYTPQYPNWSYKTWGSYAPHITIDKNNTVWIGTDGAGLWSFDGSSWMNYNYHNSDIGCQFIEQIVVDTHNNKWMTSWNFENSVLVFNENGVTGVSKQFSEKSIPKTLTLSQNFPNPFNPTTTIDYNLPKTTHVKIEVFDILGRLIKTLVDQEKLSGNYKVEFNASGLGSGVYFYRLQAGSLTETKKLLLLK